MVLRPQDPSEPSRTCVPAWDAVAHAQKRGTGAWWLIAQPDHADLAGDLAERIQWENFPALDADIVEAIRLHDEGWAECDRIPAARNGRPLSFLDIEPADFLKAWRGSITRAEESSAIGGLLVSSHFRRLAEFRQQTASDSPENRALMSKFLADERQRESLLLKAQRHNENEIKTLVDALQFCDLLSLYLCCGSREDVEFPQAFERQTVRAYYEDGLYRTSPALFEAGTSLGVTARKYASGDVSTTLPILLA